MKLFVKKKGEGFVTIYTDQDSLPSWIKAPLKKPYLILEISDISDNTIRNFFLNYCKPDSKLFRNNYIAYQGLFFAITSPRRIIDIINDILEHFNFARNNSKIAKLKAFKMQFKDYKIAFPRKEKLISNYNIIAEEKKPLRTSSDPCPNHKISRCFNIQNPTKIYIFKHFDCGRKITELEAFNGYCYRLLLNHRTPKVRSVRNEKGKRIGVFSSIIPNFKSLHDHYLLDKRIISPKALIAAGIGRILAAAFLENENDLHGGNVSYDMVSKVCYKIDHDQANYLRTEKYLHEKRKHHDPMCISVENIENFPFLNGCDARNFLSAEDATSKALWEEDENGQLIKDNKDLIKDAYTVFLKRVLLKLAVYADIIEATVASFDTQVKLIEAKERQSILLEDALLKSKKFVNFMLENPGLKQEIIAEFDEYNKDYKKADEPLRIDLKAIAKAFDAFKGNCLRMADKAEVKRIHIPIAKQLGVEELSLRKVIKMIFKNLFANEDNLLHSDTANEQEKSFIS